MKNLITGITVVGFLGLFSQSVFAEACPGMITMKATNKGSFTSKSKDKAMRIAEKRASGESEGFCSLMVRTECGNNIGCTYDEGSDTHTFKNITGCEQDTFDKSWTCDTVSEDTCSLDCYEFK